MLLIVFGLFRHTKLELDETGSLQPFAANLRESSRPSEGRTGVRWEATQTAEAQFHVTVFHSPRDRSTREASSLGVKARQKSPRQLKPLLVALAEEGVVCVGGQSVNLWSLLYQQPRSEPWKSLQPFTSYDVDGLADRAQMLRLAKRLEQHGWSVEAYLPRSEEAGTPNTGKLVVRRGRLQVELDLLHTLAGLSAEEIRTRAVDLEWEGVVLRVLHPLLCVESKTYNLLSLPQTSAKIPRQDMKHLLLSVANLRQHLLTQSKVAPETALIETAQRLVDFASHQPGLDVARLHRIELLDAIPWKQWRKCPRLGLARFAGTEDATRDRVRTRMAEIEEVNQWLQKLQAKKEGT